MYKLRFSEIKTQEELDALLNFWMKILGLEDWEIYAEFKHKEYMDECDGMCTYNFTQKEAKIYLLFYSEYENAYYNYNMEKTLIHELLHVKFGLVDVSSEKDETIEDHITHQLINDLAKSFYDVVHQEKIYSSNSKFPMYTKDDGSALTYPEK